MKNTARAVALVLGAGLTSVAMADESVVVVTPAADQAAVVATAKLDVAVVEQTAALELFGLSSSVTTGLIFATVALTTFVVTTDGDAQGAPTTPTHH